MALTGEPRLSGSISRRMARFRNAIAVRAVLVWTMLVRVDVFFLPQGVAERRARVIEHDWDVVPFR